MHVCQPAARKDAQPDQKDVLDPETREPALWGQGNVRKHHTWGACAPFRRPPPSRQPPGLVGVFSPISRPLSVPEPGRGLCLAAPTLKYTGR